MYETRIRQHKQGTLHVTFPSTAYVVAGRNIQNLYKMCFVLKLINLQSQHFNNENYQGTVNICISSVTAAV
jgi:hypothetical protein